MRPPAPLISGVEPNHSIFVLATAMLDSFRVSGLDTGSSTSIMPDAPVEASPDADDRHPASDVAPRRARMVAIRVQRNEFYEPGARRTLPCTCAIRAEPAEPKSVDEEAEAKFLRRRLRIASTIHGVAHTGTTAWVMGSHCQQGGGGAAGFGAGIAQGLLLGAVEAMAAERHARNMARPKLFYGTKNDGEGNSYFATGAVAGLIAITSAVLIYVAYAHLKSPSQGRQRRHSVYADCMSHESELDNYLRYKVLSD